MRASDALVIHLESPSFSDVTVRDNVVEAGAAVPLTALISHAARAGLAGLEILTGIPGTVGGALRGNAGGRQGAIGQFVRRAMVLDLADEIQVRERDDLNFADRDSNLDEPVILSAEFELAAEDPETLVRRMRRIWIVKKENQPYGYQFSGCIFKNPAPDVSAGTLIDQAGLKGTRFGGPRSPTGTPTSSSLTPAPRRPMCSSSSNASASASGNNLVTNWIFRSKSGKIGWSLRILWPSRSGLVNESWRPDASRSRRRRHSGDGTPRTSSNRRGRSPVRRCRSRTPRADSGCARSTRSASRRRVDSVRLGVIAAGGAGRRRGCSSTSASRATSAAVALASSPVSVPACVRRDPVGSRASELVSRGKTRVSLPGPAEFRAIRNASLNSRFGPIGWRRRSSSIRGSRK